MDLGAAGHLGRVGLLLCKIGCLCIRENYKQIKLYKLNIRVPVIKSLVTELKSVGWEVRALHIAQRHQSYGIIIFIIVIIIFSRQNTTFEKATREWSFP